MDVITLAGCRGALVSACDTVEPWIEEDWIGNVYHVG